VTPPYTPQHNGLAEQRNRTLLNMTRCMLRGNKLSHHFWGEAVSTTTYVLNRCPTKKLQDCTLEEAWTGIKPTVHHFRVFGSLSPLSYMGHWKKRHTWDNHLALK